jgi:hypothetical protein
LCKRSGLKGRARDARSRAAFLQKQRRRIAAGSDRLQEYFASL